MNKLITRWFFALVLSSSVMHVMALEYENLPDIKEGIVSIKLQDPERSVGYTVGDILTRHISLEIKKPYQLIEESLPIVGYERRFKGQLIGIDLSHITHEKKEIGDSVRHDLSLSYQVFTNNVVAKNGALPAEYLRILNTSSKEIVKYRIPSFDFAISPLSIFGAVKIENNMSGYRGPLLLDNSKQKQQLKVLLVILGLSLLGLLYMLGKHSWLPKMGGPFAKTYRLIRKSPNTQKALQDAVSSMHASLNKTAGFSLFNHNLKQFLEKKPAYQQIESEIGQFFGLSRQVFFEPNAKHAVGEQPIQWLAQFCRRCRDCERGLITDKQTVNKA